MFFLSQNYAESDFFQFAGIKIKVTDEYQWILSFFKGKTKENDLWWAIIISYAVKFTIFSDYGILS